MNPLPIPCQQCTTGLGASYSLGVAKHRGGNYFIEVLGSSGSELFGPAIVFNPAGNLAD